MKKNIVKKGIVFGIIILFVGMNIIPLTGGLIDEDKISTDCTKEEYFVSTKDIDSTALTNSIFNRIFSKIFTLKCLSVPNVVQRGDIAFCQNRPLTRLQRLISKLTHGYAEHALIYAGNNRFIESSAYIPWFYNGSKGWDLCKLGVSNTSIFFLNLWAKNIIYGKVINASSSQKNAAVKWAENQTRHPYQFCFDPPWPFHKHSWWGCPNTNGTTYNPDTGTYFKEEYYDYWYCTELIWAAYKHCDGNSGIDIGAIWHYDKKDDSWHWWIGAGELLNNVDQIHLYTDGDFGNPGTSEPLVESYQVDVGITNVTLHGKLIDDGDERCHCYVTLIGEGDRYRGFYNSESIETFSHSFGGLEPGTTYQWYAWAYNSLGKVVGEIKNFTILK